MMIAPPIPASALATRISAKTAGDRGQNRRPRDKSNLPPQPDAARVSIEHRRDQESRREGKSRSNCRELTSACFGARELLGDRHQQWTHHRDIEHSGERGEGIDEQQPGPGNATTDR